jgi:hypothetical protein
MHKYKIKKENKLKTKTLFTVYSKSRLYVSIGEQCSAGEYLFSPLMTDSKSKRKITKRSLDNLH